MGLIQVLMDLQRPMWTLRWPSKRNDIKHIAVIPMPTRGMKWKVEIRGLKGGTGVHTGLFQTRYIVLSKFKGVETGHLKCGQKGRVCFMSVTEVARKLPKNIILALVKFSCHYFDVFESNFLENPLFSYDTPACPYWNFCRNLYKEIIIS